METVIGSTAAVVPLEEVKAFLRISGSEEDALLAGLVRSAGQLCEAFTKVALIEREVEERLAARESWMRLGQTPVQAILSVAASPMPGEEDPLPSGDYAIDIDAAGDGWVRVLRRGCGRIVVRYKAGQAPDWNGVPEPLRHGVVRMAAHFYTHRDTQDASGPPAAVTALWLPYRRLRLG
jgi:uncharacterized phiE125 gp8 family phage protein